MHLRPYTGNDADELWELKRAFERGLGAGTGDEAKETTYEAKLTPDYRERYLDWVDRCIDENERCVTVATTESESDLAGYVFVLPASLSMIWDAAVLNEIYVRPAHRGTGVADDLLDTAVDVAREQDLPLERMVLDVDPDNERARAFYDRHGFEPWGELIVRDLP